MPQVIQLPSFWDQLNQGIMAGTSAYQHESDQAYQRARTKKQDDLSMLQMLISGYNQGGVDSNTVNAYATKAGIPFQVEQSPTELRRQIIGSPGGQTDLNSLSPSFKPLATPAGPSMGDMSRSLQVGAGLVGQPPATPTGMPPRPALPDLSSGTPPKLPWSEEQLRMAGLPTEHEKLIQHLEDAKAHAGLSYLNGENIGSQAAGVLGVKTPQQIQAGERDTNDELLNRESTRYASGVVNMAMQGKNAEQAMKSPAKLADTAFQAYVNDRQQQTGNSMTPVELKYARSFFDQAVQNEVQKWYQLQTPRVDAALRHREMNTNLYRDLTQSEAQITNAMSKFASTNKMILSDPSGQMARDKAKSDPTFAQDMSDYIANQQQLKIIRAQKDALGVMPKVTMPSGGTTLPKTTEVESFGNDQYKKVLSNLKLFDSSVAKQMIDNNWAKGKISQKDHDRLISDLGL